MKSLLSHCTCTTAVAAAFAMSSVAQAGMSRTDKVDNKVQVGGNGAQVQQKFQVAPRTGSTQIPFNPGMTVNGQKSGKTGIVPGNKNHIPVTDQGSNKGLPFKPGKFIDQKHTMPFTPGKVQTDPKQTLPFNPNVKIPIDVKKPKLPFNPNTKIPIDPGFGKGPKIPLDPGIGNGKVPIKPIDLGIGNGKVPIKPIDPGFGNGKGPIKPIDPGFGNGKHGHHHHHPHDWCGGICRPNWVCPTIWWYPTNGFCGHLTGGYFTNPTVVVVDQTVAVDVALTDVRFCDAGDLVAKLGPRYRIVVRNKGLADVGQFHMVIMAGMDKMPKPNSPASLVKVIGLQAGEIKAFDVRLPVESLMMGADTAGNPVPFTSLFVAVDSHEELNDLDRTNNGTVMNRMEVPLVD